MNKTSPYLFLYFFVVLLLTPFILPSLDTYYYWDWSRHLDWSYYDGSPMIAYLMKASTWLWGDNLLALNIIGLLVVSVSGLVIYRTARFFLSPEASGITCLLWASSPLLTSTILKQTTYDSPLILFWNLTVYFTVKFIHASRTRDLYLVGLCAGLLMLSKYSGVVLVLSLIMFMLTTRYRFLIRSPAFYLSIFLVILGFSPVLYWNYQHDWISFNYQLHTHQNQDGINPLLRMMKCLFITFLPALNVMLLFPFLAWKPYKANSVEKNKTILSLFYYICFFFLGFYLLISCEATIRVYWLAPYLMTSALLAGFYYETIKQKIPMQILVAFYIVISLVILINSIPRFSVISHKPLIYARLMQQLNQRYPQLATPILTTGWFEARMLYFLRDKPAIYTLPCGLPENQYGFWSQSLQEQIKQRSLAEATYIDVFDRISCIAPYFDRCERLTVKPYHRHHKNYTIYAYRCTNHLLKV